MTLWHLAHIAGFTMWLGGGLAAMMVGLQGKREEVSALPLVVRMLSTIHRAIMLPGIILAVASGGYLSAPAARASAPSAWLMLMQGAGVIAALLVLFVSLPTLSRLRRLSPVGDFATVYTALRRRQMMAGMIAGTLGLLALLGGVMHKY
ncbi:MAG: hypothetical protein ABI587_18025 [Gemmatimonadales bacterium]